MYRPLLAAIAVCLAGALGGCGEKQEPTSGDSDLNAGLTVMSFNVWYGGGSVDSGQIAAAIRAADADVVGIQEPEGNIERIAADAGMPYSAPSLHLISRYPIIPAERNGIPFGYVEVEPDRVVAVANAHLTCCPYGPNLVRNGKTAAEVEAVEARLRLPEVKPYGRALSSLADEGVPVFMTGDMNSPSHLDWTEEATTSRDLPYPLEWPASKALAEAGMRDSFREAHPDPATEPGLTWTPGTPPPDVREDETTDRIDWVLASGPAKTLDSKLVGEEGGPDVDVGVSPWGSDHRAVASTFDVDPAAAPDLVAASPRVVPRGERVTLRYALGGSGGGREVGVLKGGKPVETIPVYDGADHIAPMLGTEVLEPGRYEAGLIDSDGEVLARSPFWVAGPSGRPQVSTDGKAYAPGEEIEVSWEGAPGNKLDWIGVYPADDPSLYSYAGFVYTGARPSGRLELTRSDVGKLAPGRYRATLMLDDGYTILAEAPFRVGR